MVKIEEVSAGDVLYCVRGRSCCVLTGQRYEVLAPDNIRYRDLWFKPSCWDEHGDPSRLASYLTDDYYEFVLEKAANPW